MVRTHGDDEHEQRVIDDVQRCGWHIVAIEDGPGPQFAYSIGLFHTLGQPEIIMFGLRSTTAGKIINTIGEEMRKGAKFEDWHESDQILDGYSCIFRKVDPDLYSEYVGYAMWFYRPDKFPVLQCVWPDKAGRYPWQPGVTAEFFERQPILAQRQGWPFHQGKNRAVFTTRPVLEGEEPIRLVTHDQDGDWQFLCGTTNRTEDGRVVCFKTIFDGNPSLAELADLPDGWKAFRESPDQPWRRMKSAS